MRSAKIRVYLCTFFVILVCWSYAFSQTTQTRLKLADGSYMTVDDAWESPQGVWYRQGGISHLLAKEKVKKIDKITAGEAMKYSVTGGVVDLDAERSNPSVNIEEYKPLSKN